MSVTQRKFGSFCLYTLENKSGAKVSLTDLGAAVQSIMMPDRNNVLGDVVLGYDTPEEYIANDGYFGASIGRYANRIKGARFKLDGREYKLTENEGSNILHGGVGFVHRRFETVAIENSAVTFRLCDADGTDGFPGNLEVSVKYELTGDNRLIIRYSAISDRNTVINLTNHSYFNLSGCGDILSHELQINADYYLPVDDELIPTGEIKAVDGTEFDFRSLREIKNGYYDHCYVLNDEFCAELYDRASGRKLRVTTDMPGVQFYAGGATGERKGKGGAVYGRNSALCLETQFFPDSPNRPDFPIAELEAGQLFTSCTTYAFSVE